MENNINKKDKIMNVIFNIIFVLFMGWIIFFYGQNSDYGAHKNGHHYELKK